MNQPQISSRYTINRIIGRGGAGAVYEATDLRLARRVAIKVIPLSSEGEGTKVQRRIFREASLTSALSHPNIVSVYDIGEHEQNAFIVMEFVSGSTLESRLSSTPPSEWWAKFFPALAQCGAAIDY